MEHHVTLREEEVAIPDRGLWPRLPIIGLVLGVVGLGLAFLMGQGNASDFYHSYLVAFYYFLTFALGGLFFVLVQYATRAGWSVVVRRVAEHIMATIPIFALLFLPILFVGFHDLYHWSEADAVAHDHLLQHKEPYLNYGFFAIRAVLYFVIWTALAVHFWRKSTSQDESREPAVTRRLQSLSAPALILYALSLTFAAFDWIMSLDPHWYSTIFGVYIFAGCVISICGLLCLLILRLQGSERLRGVVSWEHFHDLGKLLFAFTVFWAYIAFSQFMLIWYGNIPEETIFFAHRWEHGWKAVSIFLAAGHFGLPFLFLLLRDVKRNRLGLTLASLWLLAVHYVDIYWLVMPTLHHEKFSLSLLDFTCWLGIGGLFLALLSFLMQRGALVPLRDPRLAESLAFEN